jgi:sigma-B regulation protein RsbU (phosphoserine phosphatase)
MLGSGAGLRGHDPGTFVEVGPSRATGPDDAGMSGDWPSALGDLLARDFAELDLAPELGSWLRVTGHGERVAVLKGDEARPGRWRCVALHGASPPVGGHGDEQGTEKPRDEAHLDLDASDLDAVEHRGFAAVQLGPRIGWTGGPEGLGPGDRALFVPLPGAGPGLAALVADDPDASDALRDRRALLLNLGATALARARDVSRLRRSETRLSRELRDVARIQQLLLPSQTPSIRGLDVAARLDGFGLAAGDYYDYAVLSHRFVDDPERLEEDFWSLMVADVTGHGAAAAVEVAMFDALLRAFAPDREAGPADALTFVNDHFFTRLGRPHFVTAFGVLFDPTRGAIRYCNAGHPPPLLVRTRRGGAIEWLDDGDDIPVGVVPDHRYQGASRAFDREDLLVLYTDGVIEAASPDGELFGADRLAAAVHGAAASPGEVLEAIRTAVKKHEAGHPPRDDRTLVVARRRAG